MNEEDPYFISEEEAKRIEELPYKIPLKLRQLLNGFKYAVRKKNTSVVIVVDGRSGMGKTTLSFQIGKYCDGDFTLANVYFHPQDFIKGLSEAKPYSVHILDEAMILSSRASMSQINKAMIQAMSMIRSKKIIVLFCINSIFDLDRNLALSRADILLNVYGDSLTDRGKFMAFFKGEDGQDRLKMLYLLGKKYYDYSKPKSNFNTTFSSHFLFDNNEYEKKKQEGVNRFLQGESKSLKNITVQHRDNLVLYLRYTKGLSVEEISRASGLAERSVYDVLGKYKQKEEVE